MNDDLAVISKHFPKKEIRSFLCEPQEDLRFVLRNGEKVLQQLMRVEVRFTKEYWSLSREDFSDKGSANIWMDVPTCEAGEE